MKHVSSLWLGWPVAGLFLIMLWLAGPAARAQAPAWQMATGAGGAYSKVTATTTDASGNVYSAGNFTGTISFGAISLTSTGGTDMFITKWSRSSGSFVWAQRAGGTADDYAAAVAVSGANVYVAGGFASSTAGFGSIVLSNTAIGANDVFVAKLADAGTTAAFSWAQQVGGVGFEGASALAISGSNVYMAGTFSSQTITIGSTILTKSSTNPIIDNGFIAKLSDAGTTGSFAWAQACGGRAYPNRLAASGANVYVVGNFTGGPTSFGNITLTNVAYFDVFVAKLVDMGSISSYAWAQQAGGTGADQAFAVAVSGSNVYVAGIFDSPTASFGSVTVATAGTFDVFVTKLTDAGPSSTFTWAVRAGGTDSDAATALAVSGTSLYLAGGIGSTAAGFGNSTLTNAANTQFNQDGFVAKLTDAGSSAGFIWAKQLGGAGDDLVNAVAINGTSLYVAGYISPSASFDNQTIASPVGATVGFLASLTDPTLTATTPALSGAAFTLAPNPAHTSTTVTLSALPGTASATLTLLDALGRAVRTTTVALPPAGLRHELNLTGLAPGLYALRVAAGPATVTRRLVVE